jgi:hypothetical protein
MSSGSCPVCGRPYETSGPGPDPYSSLQVAFRHADGQYCIEPMDAIDMAIGGIIGKHVTFKDVRINPYALHRDIRTLVEAWRRKGS